MDEFTQKLLSFLRTYEKPFQLTLIFLIVSVSLLIGRILFIENAKEETEVLGKKTKVVKKIAKKPLPTKSSKKISPTLNPTVIPTKNQLPTSQFLIGMGPEADQALNTRLVKEAPVKMLTSWYNGPDDLKWMTLWKHDLVPQSYAKGYTLHLIVFTEHPDTTIQTKYGPACGQEYPLSGRFVDDMRQLADTFKGSGKLYVTLFTEFQTYPCEGNQWQGAENYYNTLKDQYRAAKDVFHQVAPNSNVAISWGGWQARWDDPAKGAGRSLIPYFADIMKESDFTAFQAMESGSNVQDVKDMTKILSQYKRPVMLSHYMPDSRSPEVFDADVRAMFTDSYMKEVQAYGLFAFSFMGPDVLNQREDTYQFIKEATVKYAK